MADRSDLKKRGAAEAPVRALSPIIGQLLQSAREEEKLLAAIRNALLRGGEGKEEVVQLASELIRHIDQPQVAPDSNRIQPIPRLLRQNCSDLPTSAFLKP